MSYFLATGIVGSTPSDLTIPQKISQLTGIMAPSTENKPVGQVNLKEMIHLLNNEKIEKRTRVSMVMGCCKTVYFVLSFRLF